MNKAHEICPEDETIAEVLRYFFGFLYSFTNINELFTNFSQHPCDIFLLDAEMQKKNLQGTGEERIYRKVTLLIFLLVGRNYILILPISSNVPYLTLVPFISVLTKGSYVGEDSFCVGV